MKARLTILSIFLLILVSSVFSHAHADAATNDPTIEHMLNTLSKIESEFIKSPAYSESHEIYLKILPEYRNWATRCMQARENEQQDMQKNLGDLGEFIKGEAVDVTNKRKSLKENLLNNEKLQSTCKLILLRSEESLERITKLKQSYLTERFLFRGPGFIKLLRENWEHRGIWLNASKEFVLENSGLNNLTLVDFFILLTLITTTIIITLLICKRLRAWLIKQPPAENHSSQLANAFTQTAIRYLPYLLPSLASAGFFYALTNDITPIPFISIVAYGLPIVSLFLALIHTFLGSSLELGLIKQEQVRIARKLSHRLKSLVLFIFLGYLLFSTILSQSLPESALLLTRGIYGAVIILNLIMVIWLVGRFNKVRSNQIFRIFIVLFLFGALIAEFYGYRNISMYILRTILGSLIALDIFKLLGILTAELIDSLEHGKGHWQQKLRASMALKPEQAMPGTLWIRIIINLLLWAGLISSLIILWKVPDNYAQTLISYITTGFTIGSVEILPLRVLQAILALPFLLTINAWFKRGLEQRWLKRTQMERGTRESMATIAGYTGISIAIIISLSIAGMDFSKLALIAGALSVGIGFGLQNIVNNFVSGLILLFERPIKTGDWIQVGAFEGYVRKISIRSTQIQTFDRSDIIVPNSDLISGSVTNWMLYDQRGRIRVPIGVAYGSDTQLVKKLLLQVAKENEQVIDNIMLAPLPIVLFLQFGDSSLNFELRCHIKNIDTRQTTISEINFAIDEIFRENNIEIPFPQRDVHVRDVSNSPVKSLKQAPEDKGRDKDPS